MTELVPQIFLYSVVNASALMVLSLRKNRAGC